MNPFCIPINNEADARFFCLIVDGYRLAVLISCDLDFSDEKYRLTCKIIRGLLKPAEMPLIHSGWFPSEFPDLYKLLIS